MKPSFRLFANDKEITEKIRDRLITLTLEDESGYANDGLDLVLDDRDHLVAAPSTGTELRLYLGYGTGVFDMGLFIVDEVELRGPPSTMVIRSQGANVTVAGTKMLELLKSQKSRSWHDMTLGEIFTQIVSETRYGGKIDANLASERIAHVDQTDESYMNFLYRLAQDRDAVFKIANTVLMFLPKAAFALSRDGKPMPIIDIVGPLAADTNVVDWSLTLAEREVFTTVQAFYHDYDLGKRMMVTAGSGDRVKTLSDNFPTKVEANAAALAELARIQRGRSTGEVTIVGNPLAVAEMRAQLSSFRPEFNGEWSVQRAIHTFDSSGYITKLELQTPRTG